MPELPPEFSDPEELSRNIYDYWISLLRTDKVIEDGAAAVWSEMETELKEDFVESIRVHVIDALEPFVQEADRIKQIVMAYQNSGAAANCRCYVCDRNPVDQAGWLCGPCSYAHLPRTE